MIETIELGSVPYNEPCAETTDPDYASKACAECNRYRAQLARAYSAAHSGRPLPKGCRLVIKSNNHDYGTYYEVAVKFDGSDAKAGRAALWFEANLPESWDSVAMWDNMVRAANNPDIGATY
jgi:hypothetical protein